MKYIKLLLCLCLLYTPFAFAVELPPNNSWSWKHHEKMREQARLKARLVKQINESGSSKTVTAIVETKPTASKVGGAMFKRLAASGGGQMIGVLAVTQLIEAIGWVMDEGSYVKLVEKPPENPKDPSNQYYYQVSSNTETQGSTMVKSCDLEMSRMQKNSNQYNWGRTYTKALVTPPTGSYAFDCTLTYKTSSGSSITDSPNQGYKYPNPLYNPTAPKPDPTKVPLTPQLLGAAMMGSGYNDPDPNFDNSSVNNDQWTGVPESYTPDPSGVGNELAEELDNKADNAPSTNDGKESSFGDPAYDKDITFDRENDRSWQSGDGTQGTTENTQTTDPETGATTDKGSFNLPAFCDWAMTMCQWYDDWTSSDKVQKDHMTKTEEHQTQEKSFWQDVKDWFDWTKEPVDEEPETEEQEPDTQGIFDRTFDTAFSLSKECPPDIPFSLETEFFSGSWNISMNWLCIIFTFLGYPLVFLSHCVGLWILYEAVVQREIKW